MIAGGGPTGLMLAGELALSGVDVVVVERRASQDVIGSRAGGLHSRTIEIFDQRGIADRFLAEGTVAQIAGFAWIRLDMSDLPTRHPYGLALRQHEIERILAGWVDELGVPIERGRDVTGFAQDDTGVHVELSDGQLLRAEYLVGCDGGRSLIRKAAGIAFPGWDPTVSHLIAQVEMTDEPVSGLRRDAHGIHSLVRNEDGRTVGVLVTEAELGRTERSRRWPISARRSSRRTGPTSGSTAPRRSRGSPMPPVRPRPTAKDACSSRATPHTCTTRWVARASRSACRMR